MSTAENILVIEDDEEINRVLCNIIRKKGYTPKSAYFGTEAIIFNKDADMFVCPAGHMATKNS